MLFLGDQVYADETTEEMQEFIKTRRDIEVPPGKELKDFEEYAHLYKLAWSDPLNRWLLSTLPSSMIFDDHDVRDDWNTSYAWKQEIEKTDWWHGRIVSGLGSYWIYQHLGNLSPKERADDELWQCVVQHDGDDEIDLTERLDARSELDRRQPRQVPVELRARHRRRAAGGRRRAVERASSARTPASCSTTTRWAGWRTSSAATSSTC